MLFLFLVPRTVHHVRDVQCQRHERGDPRDKPEVRLMTFNLEEFGGVDCQSALLSLTCGVCGHCRCSAPRVFAVITEMFRNTPNVIDN